MRKGCCIVETRPIANLVEIIVDYHLKYIPKDWGITLYLSLDNVHLVKDVDFGRKTNIVMIPPGRFDESTYNVLLKSRQFWYSLPYDKVLIFQSDSRLLREGIEDYLEYDYIGAAWKFQEHGGNGGLSLRDVNVMKEIVETFKFSTRNEDVLFCNIMRNYKVGNLASREKCMEFSVETIFGLGSLGVHAIDKWLSKEECKQILEQYGRS